MRQRNHWLNKEAYGGGVDKVKRGQPTATEEEAKGEEHAVIHRQKGPVFTNSTAHTPLLPLLPCVMGRPDANEGGRSLRARSHTT